MRRTLAACLLTLFILALLPVRLTAQEPAKPATKLELVKSAKTMLQGMVNREVQTKGYKPKVVTSREAPLDITLAAWNETSQEFVIIELTKQGKRAMVSEPKDLKVEIKRDNGTNSEFTVTGRPELHVLALIHPIFNDIGTTRRPKFRLENAVYVPYTDYINSPDVVAAGQAYLDRNITAVYDELRVLGVRSLAFPELSLADAITPGIIKSIIAIEHVSAASLLRGNVDEYLNAFYVILAANENTAYAYARSSASARGLAQFIPSTYKSLLKIRPDLTLNQNFDQGMDDPFNAIKAQTALLDYNLTLLPKSVRLKYEQNPKMLGAYLAAIYNGGSTRLRRAVAYWGEAWANDHTAELQALKSQEQSAAAEAKRLKGELAKKGLKAAQKTALNKQLKEAQTKASQAKTKYNAGKAALLKTETALYVAKYYLVYDYFVGSKEAS